MRVSGSKAAGMRTRGRMTGMMVGGSSNVARQTYGCFLAIAKHGKDSQEAGQGEVGLVWVASLRQPVYAHTALREEDPEDSDDGHTDEALQNGRYHILVLDHPSLHTGADKVSAGMYSTVPVHLVCASCSPLT